MAYIKDYPNYHLVRDDRGLVEDSEKYPHEAVAYIETDYFTHDNEFFGTGFLCENSLFITAAHNVRDKDRKPANNVQITFGLNGREDYFKKKQILLNGCDFIVPEKYEKPTDKFDIAWVDLKQYHCQKVAEGHQLEWDLTHLPNQCFYTCSIPAEEGILDEALSLSGI